MPVYFETENNIFRAATKSRPAAYFVARALIQCHSGGTPNNVMFIFHGVSYMGRPSQMG